MVPFRGRQTHRQTLAVEVSLQSIFNLPSIATLLQKVAQIDYVLLFHNKRLADLDTDLHLSVGHMYINNAKRLMRKLNTSISRVGRNSSRLISSRLSSAQLGEPVRSSEDFITVSDAIFAYLICHAGNPCAWLR